MSSKSSLAALGVVALVVLGFFYYFYSRDPLINVPLDLFRKIHQNRTDYAEAIINLKQALPDDSVGNDLVPASQKLVRRVLRKEIDLQEVTDEVGWSGDRVFRVINPKNGQPEAILKIYREASENLFPEVYALDFLSRHRFPSPRILGLGTYQANNDCYFALCESLAPGRSVLTLFKQADFAILSKGISACGKSLAKLHRYRSRTLNRLPAAYETKMRQYLKETIEKLKQYPQLGIDDESLVKLFEQTVINVQSKPIPSGIAHGDTKMINVFFDADTGEVTWIDPSKLAASLDSEETPCGMPAKDINSFLDDIAIKQIEFNVERDHLVTHKKIRTDAQIEFLKQAFLEGYVANGGILPSQEEIALFSLGSHLYFVANTGVLDPACRDPEPLKTSKRYRIQLILDDIRRRLSDKKYL